MPKTLGALYLGRLAAEVTTFAICFKLRLKDGGVMGFTDFDDDLTFDLADGDGSITYHAATGFYRSATRAASQLKVSDLELEGLLDSEEITEEDLRAGKYDFAEVEIFRVDYEHIAYGREWLHHGWLGEIKFKDNSFIVELRGLAQKYTQNLLEYFTPVCRTDLGDERCGIPLEPDAWEAATDYAVGDFVTASVYDARQYECTTAGTSDAVEPTWSTSIASTTTDATVTWTAREAWRKQGTVTAVVDRRSFSTDLTDAADRYRFGVLTWLSGANAGRKAEVKTHAGTGDLALYLEVGWPIVIGDTFAVVAGCDKTLSTCRDVFHNTRRFRGEPHVPGDDAILYYPDAR